MVKIKDVLNLEKIQQFQSQELQKLQEQNGKIKLLTHRVKSLIISIISTMGIMFWFNLIK